MTQRVRPPDFGGDYQLPPGQLWWILRYTDGEKVSETLFTFDGESLQTWFYAKRWAEILLRELDIRNPIYTVNLAQ